MRSSINRLFYFLIVILVATDVFAQPGTTTTVAGNGGAGFSGDGGPATSASLNGPYAVAVGSDGSFYIADFRNHRIRKVNVNTGVITTVAGNGAPFFEGDGGTATSAALNHPQGVTVDSAGNIYIGDSLNNRIRKVNTNGIITTIAGTGSPGYNGDGAALNAELNDPAGVVLDSAGNLYIADQASHRIRKLTPGGTISTYAGTGQAGFGGDGGAATSARLYNPTQLAIDRAGNLYIGDTFNHRVRKVNTSTGIISTVAGNGKPGFSGDGGQATSAQLDNPQGVAVDSSGHLYIADTFNKRIRQVNLSNGIIRTVAEDTNDTGCGSARIEFPIGLTLHPSGDRLYISDHSSNLIRLLTPGDVTATATLSSISPSSGVQGTVQSITLTGTNFTRPGCRTGEVSVSISGTGVTVSNVKLVSSTSLTATFTVAPSATLGPRDVTVTTENGPTNSRQFTVVSSVPPAPTLTSISPGSGLRGTTVNVTLNGTNFQTGSGATTIAVSGSGVSAGNVSVSSATSMTATLTIAAGASLGNYNVTVRTAGGTSNAVVFAVNPQGVTITYNMPQLLNPTEQVPVQLTLETPSPDPVTGKLTLTFTANASNNADDPNVTLINAQASARDINFTFPANATTAEFSLPGVLLRAGTVAGTMRLTMTEVQVGGRNVTPSNGTHDVTVPRLVPTISTMRVVNLTASGFEVEVTGYSTSKDITAALFQFAASAGGNLGTVQLQPDVTAVFAEYYQTAKSAAVGSAFVYIQPFMVQGDINAIASVTLTLTNAQGTSQPKTANLR